MRRNCLDPGEAIDLHLTILSSMELRERRLCKTIMLLIIKIQFEQWQLERCDWFCGMDSVLREMYISSKNRTFAPQTRNLHVGVFAYNGVFANNLSRRLEKTICWFLAKSKRRAARDYRGVEMGLI